MRKLYYSFVLALAVIAVFSVSNLAVAAAATDDERFIFLGHVSDLLGLQGGGPIFLNAQASETGNATRSAQSEDSASVVPVQVLLPVMSSLPGSAITVPITVGNTTGLGIISYDMQVSFDPAVLTPASPPIDRTGTLSSAMLVTPNPGFPGHLIITGFQATSLSGSGTLLFLKFNVTGSPGQSTALTFEDYTDPNSGEHTAFAFNEGQPPVTTTNGSFTVSTPTPTATNTNTPTDTPTSTATNTATNTPTNTPTNTATSTATSTPTDTPTATATNTPTPASSPVIAGTVTYGNAIGAPTPRFVSNVLISGAGSPNISAMTGFPDGAYSLSGFGADPYIVTPSKTGGTNAAINSFDAGRVAAHVTGNSTLTGNQLVAADVSGNGLVQSFDAGLIARYVTASGPSGSTGTWKFLPVNRTYATVNSNLAGEDYTAFLMGDVSGNWTNTGARPVGGRQLAVGSWQDAGPERGIEIKSPSMVTRTGDEVIVPVSVDGVASKGIIAYEFDLRYDPSVIQPDANPVELSETVSRGLTAVANASEPGLLRVAVYGAIPIDGNGILLNLRFTAVGANGSVSPLTWERIMFNDGDMRTVAANGQVEIREDSLAADRRR